MRSNCLAFALRLWWRRSRKGKPVYLLARRSRWGRFPHFLVGEVRAGRMRLVSYVPRAPRDKSCPPPCFSGRVKWGDT